MSARRSSAQGPLTVILAVTAAAMTLSLSGVLIYRFSTDPTAGAPASAAPSEPPTMAAQPVEDLDPVDRLPRVEDLGLGTVRWTEGDTYISPGPTVPDAACVTADDLAQLTGSSIMGRRDFTGARSEARFTAWVLDYATGTEAAEHEAEFQQLIADCMQDHQKPNGPYQVATEVGPAHYSEALVAVPDSGQSSGIWNSVGVVRFDTRLEVLSLTFRSPENHFRYQPGGETGLPLHPMLQTLPKAAARLR
jgi:hypothetical protein